MPETFLQLVSFERIQNFNQNKIFWENILEITRDSAGSELELFSDEDDERRMGRRNGYGMGTRRRR